MTKLIKSALLAIMVAGGFAVEAAPGDPQPKPTIPLPSTNDEPVRIMCLGDSITVGYTDNPHCKVPFKFGYRSRLYKLLKEAGYHFTFVGDSPQPWDKTSGDPSHGGTYKPEFDLRDLGRDHHQGGGGAPIDALKGWVTKSDPDIILLMIGINGISKESPARIRGLVETIVTEKPNAHLIVAQITPYVDTQLDKNKLLYGYNVYIRDTLVPEFAKKGHKVGTVDMYSLFLSDPDNYESAVAPDKHSNKFNHPFNEEYDLMADRWFAAIEALELKEPKNTDQKFTPEQIGWECFPLKPDQTLEYKTVAGKDGMPVELKLQVFLPEGWKPSDQRPAAVFFHGGGWHGCGPDHYYPQSRYVALRGMVGISVEYRTINRFGSSPKECVKDGKSAMRWVKTHARELGIDPERIVAGGGSAGGHIAADTALVRAFDEEGENTSVSCIPKALLLFNPVFDNGPDGFGHDWVKPYWKQISPIDHINDQTPPTMVLLGTEDTYIPVETAKRFEQLMKENGRRCDLHLYEGAKHGWYNLWVNREAMAESLIRMDRFLTSLGYLHGEPLFE